jgi:hypothetical protein
LPSSRRTSSARRKTFLNLSGQIEGELREAYDRKFQAGECTQTSLAKKLDVNRSAIHHRLNGHTNMTTETIADMVWAMEQAIKIEIFDPKSVRGLNYWIQERQPPAAPSPPKASTPTVAEPNRDLIDFWQQQGKGALVPEPA